MIYNKNRVVSMRNGSTWQSQPLTGLSQSEFQEPVSGISQNRVPYTPPKLPEPIIGTPRQGTRIWGNLPFLPFGSRAGSPENLLTVTAYMYINVELYHYIVYCTFYRPYKPGILI